MTDIALLDGGLGQGLFQSLVVLFPQCFVVLHGLLGGRGYRQKRGGYRDEGERSNNFFHDIYASTVGEFDGPREGMLRKSPGNQQKADLQSTIGSS